MKSISSYGIKKLLASRWFLPGVGGLFLVIIGMYVWWSITSWNSYNERVITAEKQAAAKLRTTLDLKTDTREQRAAKLTALAETVNQLPSDESLCDVNGLIGWQRVFGDLKARETTCKEHQEKLVVIRRSLERVIGYLEAEHALAKIVGAAPAGGEIAEDAWVSQKDLWSELLKNIDNFNSNGDFDPIKLATKDAIASLVGAWNELIAAHQAKDKNKYLNASTALLGAYEGLKTVSQKDADNLRILLHKVEEAYKQLPAA